MSDKVFAYPVTEVHISDGQGLDVALSGSDWLSLWHRHGDIRMTKPTASAEAKVIYQCGCEAAGGLVANYCPQHDKPMVPRSSAADAELNAMAKTQVKDGGIVAIPTPPADMGIVGYCTRCGAPIYGRETLSVETLSAPCLYSCKCWEKK